MASELTARSRFGAAAFAAALAFSLFGCGGPNGEEHPTALQSHEGQTTDGTVALNNLSAQIRGHERSLAARPHDRSVRASLVQLLLLRTQYAGSYSDFDRALELAGDGIARHPEDASAHIALARALAAVHRFEEALEHLADAERLGADVEDSRAGVLLALGRDLDEAFETRLAAANERPSTTTLAGLAAVHAARGEFDLADERYLEALRHHRDTSPFPIASIEFQRGVMWSEMADRPDLGEARYREATNRIPGFVVANVHLAELEGRRTAIERLRVLETEDPEPLGLLAELVEDSEAQKLAAAAIERYDALLARHRAAFADHGAEFFTGPGGDPARGLELARFNLSQRKTDRAYQVAIESAFAARETQLACSLAAEAGPERASVPLQQLVQETLRECE